jgi:hypothetical protein
VLALAVLVLLTTLRGVEARERPDAPSGAPLEVKGGNVTRVACDAPGAASVFVQQASGEWTRGNVTFHEDGRDEWSVYLSNDRGVKAQLDLFRKQVIISGAHSATFTITEATADPPPSPAPTHEEGGEPAASPSTPGTEGETGADVAGVIYEDVPDMPDADLEAVLHWIEVKTTGERLPFCWRQSYGNGVGVPLNTCPPGTEQDGLLCYPPCNDGYYGVGPVCWQKCPDGFRDDGAFCRKPDEYGRGAGRVPDVTCPPGFSQRGIGAAAWCDNGPTLPWDLQTTAAGVGCHDDEEINGGLCYPRCAPNFHPVGCCVCSADCPADFGADMGVSCTKQTYGRGAGVPMICAPDQQQDAALCYPPCQEGFHLVGPLCWQDCSPGWTPCGAGCSKNADPIMGVEVPWSDCALTITDQALSVVTVAANIATLGLAAPETGAMHAGETITVGSKTLSGGSRVGKSLVKLVNAFQSVKPEGLAKDATVVRRIRAVKLGSAKDKVLTSHEVSSNAYALEQDFETTFAADFVEQTSQEIASEIDRRLPPDVALYVKRSWGSAQLVRLAGTEGFEALQDGLAIVSIVDISGVTGVVSAFAKPMCQSNIPFPTLSKSYD